MSEQFRTSCDECGWVSKLTTEARAAYAFRVHSCEKQRRRDAQRARGEVRRAAVDKTPKPCLHKKARHQHGTRAAYVLDHCRCTPCSKANRAAEANRTRQAAYGRWQPYVDAEPARAHVSKLTAAGVGWKRVAALAGVPITSIGNLIYGRRRRPGVPLRKSSKLRRETAERILAVPLDPGVLAGGARVDPQGTRRRLRALVRLGWSMAKLAAELGWSSSNFGLLIHDGQEAVSASTARSVADLYERLSMTLPPATNQREKISVSRARRYAETRGWLPPLALDDDALDQADVAEHDVEAGSDIDEVAVERAMAGQRVRLTHAEKVEAVNRMRARGDSYGRIETLTGLKPDRYIIREAS